MAKPILFVDETHLGRHVTGLERITLELFSAQALAPLPVQPARRNGSNGLGMIRAQNLDLPALLLRHRQSMMLCPGFPPSLPLTLFGARVVPYVHDVFLLTRPEDLNWRARYYMAPALAFALKRLPWLLVNSETTRAEVRPFARADATVSLYRPVIRDVFGIADQAGRPRSWQAGTPLRLIAIGTVEPRKNLLAAASIVAALIGQGIDAHLDIVGRPGWGGDAEALRALPQVTLHGYLPPEAVRERLGAAHALITTSHDEGLGLTLLEAQHGGLPVIASNLPVFREALGDSGLLIDPSDAAGSAQSITRWLARPETGSATATNLRRWNDGAARDRDDVIARLERRLAGL